jgi:hypothetical protein
VFGSRKGVAKALHDAQGALERALASRTEVDLDAAVKAGESVAAAAKTGSQERLAALLLVGEARAARYEASRSLPDVAACVAVYRELKDLAPADDWSTTAVALQRFASYSLVLGSVTGKPQPMADAVATGQDLAARAEANGDPDSLLAAAEVLRLAHTQLPAEHADHGAVLGVYGSTLLTWTKMTGDAAQLDTATAALDAALRLCTPGTANHPPFLVILGELQRIRYQFSGTLPDLDRSLDTMIRTLELYPPAHPVFAVTAHDIGVGYVMKKELSGEPTDVDQAERYLRIAALRTADPSLRARAQEALAGLAEPRRPPPPADRLRFLAGPGSRPQRPASMVGDDVAELAAHAVQLRIALQQYERTGDLTLVEKIRDDGHALLAALPEGHPDRWQIGGPLGAALVRRFQRHARPGDIDEAVDLLRESVHRPDHGFGGADRIDDLSNLAVALVARGGRNNDVADLGEAIPHARRAVRLTPHGAPERSGYLGVLGTALVYRSMLTGDRLDADESIAVGQEVLAGARSAAERADAHTKLANRLRHRFRLTGQIDDSDAAIGHLRAAYGMTNDPALRAAMQEALDERAR